MAPSAPSPQPPRSCRSGEARDRAARAAAVEQARLCGCARTAVRARRRRACEARGLSCEMRRCATRTGGGAHARTDQMMRRGRRPASSNIRWMIMCSSTIRDAGGCAARERAARGRDRDREREREREEEHIFAAAAPATERAGRSPIPLDGWGSRSRGTRVDRAASLRLSRPFVSSRTSEWRCMRPDRLIGLPAKEWQNSGFAAL